MDPVDTVGGALERAGIITVERFRRTVELAWPRIVTGFAIIELQRRNPRL